MNIEDYKMNIYGCRSRSAGACAACRSVFFKSNLRAASQDTDSS
ncbi:hypothetical protein D1AOALGA4SA_7875 [Olavius algarvensis Delta 1 endosymbiont]|nr:hypothetical protein D1AOALGA4SA_7875 [Olavius algarvensis Delta 1 endosymbiont]